MTETPEDAQRVHRRQRVLKGARVIFNKGLSSYNATLKDISDGGVKLKLQSVSPVPRLFELLILNTNTGRPETHHCERRWQRGDMVGARFVDKVPDTEADPAERCSLFVPGVISGMGNDAPVPTR